jgi:hypothetical protein
MGMNQTTIGKSVPRPSGVPSSWGWLEDKYFNFGGLGLMTLLLIIPMGCQGLYFDAMEKMGYHKRDLLVSRVEDARDSQEQAKEQFRSALERFSSVLNFHGGPLQEKYEQLREEFELSEKKANDVQDRINAVEDVADALFVEWERELASYSSDRLRQTSQAKLTRTKKQYSQLLKAMKRAESKIDPVLDAFRDQVLFLKHNLNAQAIASLQEELSSMEGDIASLIQEMESSIKEADTFIGAMGKG